MNIIKCFIDPFSFFVPELKKRIITSNFFYFIHIH
ncbi:uncharacterized protein Nmag_3688 (plasmid) [Natrialba magadii ATCC 43099]|uniref:Uncharacterized protein n=1 Tax=Natrialba magadii (strain ATCC 43099 / DSM 3394 / CCM 3739 / CIP 104546 / IAM 13178 / JCM 8861 / NBRC 102185 / NCIMB 2190 / MS3) TaxID=547559 RepID=D3T0X3_NATMM|nr:uncharacterized protein Nmag_3688 [Natrialba magadii ATCC 43099]